MKKLLIIAITLVLYLFLDLSIFGGPIHKLLEYLDSSEEVVKLCTYEGETNCSITYDSLMKLCTDSTGKFKCKM